MKKIRTYRKCPVCGCAIANILFPVDIYVEDMGLPNHYDAVRCDYCGMCYANTTASESDYEHYYSTFNYYSGHPGMVKKEVSLRHEKIEDILREYSSEKQEIIDVGFGNGELLQRLKQHGFSRISGMDPSAESVNMLKKRGIKGFLGSVQQEIPKEHQEKYDIAIMTEVLEHLLSPAHAIQNLRSLLKPDGYVILTLPSFDDLSQYHLPLQNLINYEHINYYSHVSLRFFMELNGFHEIEVQKREHEVDDGSIAYGILGVYRRIDMEQNYSVTPPGGGRACIKNCTPYQDQHTGEELYSYYQKQRMLWKEKFSFMEDLRQSQRPIAVWGAGGYFRQIWYETELFKCNVVLIVDNSKQKQGTTFCNRIINSPYSLQKFKGMLLIFAVRYQNEIKEELDRMGFQGEFKFL